MANKGNTVRWVGIGVTLLIVIGGIMATWAAGNQAAATAQQTAETNRSEERRVGKECRSRWSPYQ